MYANRRNTSSLTLAAALGAPLALVMLLLLTVSIAIAGAKAKQAEMDIVDTAIHAGKFDTLVKAVQAADLVETLKSDGPFTVFAPTDEAFAKLPPATLQALLDDKAALTNVLTYHVVPGVVMAEDVVKLDSAKTVQGQNVSIDTRDGVMVDNAKVVMTDIRTSNGVIHVIDTVIIPR